MPFLSVSSRRLFLLCATGGIAWWIYTHTIVPLQHRQEAFLHQRAELQESLDSTRSKLGAIKDNEQKISFARGALKGIVGPKGDESPLITLPQDLVDHFSRFGLPSATVRLVSAQPVPNLPEYQRLYWSIGIPISRTDKNVGGLLLAVAGLEQEDHIIKVLDFSLVPDPDDQSLRIAQVSLVVFCQK
jgi:hypothetical protein